MELVNPLLLIKDIQFVVNNSLNVLLWIQYTEHVQKLIVVEWNDYDISDFLNVVGYVEIATRSYPCFLSMTLSLDNIHVLVPGVAYIGYLINGLDLTHYHITLQQLGLA